MKKRLLTVLSVLLLAAVLMPWTFAANVTATASKVLVNGKAVSFEAYNIDGNNYFKLRDLAMALSGSEKQFEVGWNGAKNAVELTSGRAYTPVGGELTAGSGKTPAVSPSAAAVTLDGKTLSLRAYNINGYNYFKLRDVGAAVNFGVGWDGEGNTEPFPKK